MPISPVSQCYVNKKLEKVVSQLRHYPRKPPLTLLVYSLSGFRNNAERATERVHFSR